MLERQFVKRIQACQDVVLDTSAADRRIDAAWLNGLGTGPERKIAYPVRIKGAVITGDIELDHAEFNYGLEFESCEFRGQISLRFASVERGLSFERCRFRLPVNLRGLNSNCDFQIVRCVFHRGLLARDITVGQDLSIEGGTFRRFHLSGAHVKKRLRIVPYRSGNTWRRTHCRQEARLLDMQVDGIAV